MTQMRHPGKGRGVKRRLRKKLHLIRNLHNDNNRMWCRRRQKPNKNYAGYPLERTGLQYIHDGFMGYRV